MSDWNTWPEPLTHGTMAKMHDDVINRNIFLFTGQWWILLTKASDAELSCFLWSTPEQTVEQTIDTPVIWDAIALFNTSL